MHHQHADVVILVFVAVGWTVVFGPIAVLIGLRMPDIRRRRA